MNSLPIEKTLGAIGLLCLTAFLLVFVNIPWEWSMFMDDTIYNAWMPAIPNLGAALLEEIRGYWSLGRFYPVKYMANLIKWRFLPLDPYVFRYFNLAVFLLIAFAGAASAMRAAGLRVSRARAFFIFLVASAIFHKPLLETISLNPIGETWVCLFFCLGAWCLFSESRLARVVLARFFFALVALSKEPAALVFFASAAHYVALAWAEPTRRGSRLAQAALDLLIFVAFLALAVYVMSQGSMVKHSYFVGTPWMQYLTDLTYKMARYVLLTLPFVTVFFLARHELARWLASGELKSRAAFVFFGVMAASYSVFMSTQGRVAYQEVPAAAAFFGLFSLVLCVLLRQGVIERLLRSHGLLLALLFSLSFFISVSRWHRFVRGIVEPRRAVENLLDTQEALTILIPDGEILGHIETMIKLRGKQAKVIAIDERLPGRVGDFTGAVFAFEFPYYMGDLPQERLTEVAGLVQGWQSTVDARTYRIYTGRQRFPAEARP